MAALRDDIDPDGLLEFSVVFTDRSLNHMSAAFQKVMRDISATLREVYKAQAVALVPGGGTYAMESVARQFATGKRAMVIRNGFFSFRWS
ncbi:MAG: alanine--glyoxylate aminotransferase family protein, partial [Alphaproteobacteria bacterium]